MDGIESIKGLIQENIDYIARTNQTVEGLESRIADMKAGIALAEKENAGLQRALVFMEQ